MDEPESLTKSTRTEAGGEYRTMHTILDAIEFVLENQGESQSPYWLASLMDEMRLWKASENRVRAALEKRHSGFRPAVAICEGS